MIEEITGIDVIGSGGSTKTLNVRAGSSLVIDSGATLTVSGGATTTIGSLTIGAGAGTITDAVATLTLTEANISLAGAVACSSTLSVGTADHFSISANGIITLNHDGTDITVDGHTTNGTLAIAGGPVSITGDGAAPDLTLAGAGSKSAAAYAAVGTHVADGGTFAFVADQMYMRITIGATVYNIPLWADA